MVATAVVAAVLALLVAPFPPLAQWVESDGWTRGIEFVIILLAEWALLGAVGIVNAKITLGDRGFATERQGRVDPDQRATASRLQDELTESREDVLRLSRVIAELEARLELGRSERAP